MNTLPNHKEGPIAATAATMAAAAIFIAVLPIGWAARQIAEASAPVSDLISFSEAEFWTCFAALFAIMNPITAVPLFVAITEGYDAPRRRKLTLAVSVTVMLSLSVAATSGQEILGFFAISIGAFRIAGGIIVLLMGLAMLQSKSSDAPQSGKTGGKEAHSQAICPIAVPLLVGPGAIATMILHSQKVVETSDYGMLATVIAVMTIATYVTLCLAAAISRFLGEAGMMVTMRLIGMVVAAIAIDMMIIGLQLSFPGIL
ncbi:MAG: MarC family protein [Hyphomicrobiales bacterium]